VANWAQNRSGTALVKAVVARLAKRGVFVYLDTGDPRHRGPELEGLLAAKAAWRGMGCWALNENELRAATGVGPDADLEAAGRRLSARLGCRIDLHTKGWCASFDGEDMVKSSWRPARPKRLTGAGDTWNAGNLAGYLLGLPTARRLALAHEVASRYVEGASGLPPTHKDLPKGLLRPAPRANHPA
jgi:ribokinase